MTTPEPPSSQCAEDEQGQADADGRGEQEDIHASN